MMRQAGLKKRDAAPHAKNVITLLHKPFRNEKRLFLYNHKG
jgi:hypothetical protein